jgi:hypothetical protein
MKPTNRKIKEAKQFSAPMMSDEECAVRLSEGYRQSFDESWLITWDEMERRLDRLFERKRAQSASLSIHFLR